MKLGATFIFSILFQILNSQNVVQLNFKDFQNKAIVFAIAEYSGNSVKSNTLGNCIINNYRPSRLIKIHAFGFADTSLVFAPGKFKGDTLSVSIRLRLMPTVLPEVMISSSKKNEVNPQNADFVLKFEIADVGLIEMLSKELILISFDDNTVISKCKSWPGAVDLVKDPYNNIYLLTEKEAHQVRIEGSKIAIDPQKTDLEKVRWNIKYCDAVTSSSIYIRRYKDFNQTLAFFAVSRDNEKDATMLLEIGDEERKRIVAAYAYEAIGFSQYLYELGLNEMTASTHLELKMVDEARRMREMLEMTYALPSYAVARQIQDTICIFAHDIDALLIFDQNRNLVRTNGIKYHHLKIWDKEILVNEENTKVYARFMSNSSPVLTEINVQTGQLKNQSIKLETHYPEKIRIKNNVAYYMGKQKDGTGNTVYTQQL